jgi:hypothetical protein
VGFWWVLSLVIQMDDVDRYLTLLSSRFPDQMVLYLDDIVKVLATTKRAVEGLIQRRCFPFETRKVGGRLCVDIIQVARYLANEQSDVSSVTMPKPAHQAGAAKPAKKVKAAKLTADTQATPARRDPDAIRKLLDGWKKEQAYNCFQILNEPVDEGVHEALPLLLMELLRVDEPMDSVDHIEIWRFIDSESAMQPELATFPLDKFAKPYDLLFLVQQRLKYCKLAIVKTFQGGVCVAEGLYQSGERVAGDPLDELLPRARPL